MHKYEKKGQSIPDRSTRDKERIRQEADPEIKLDEGSADWDQDTVNEYEQLRRRSKACRREVDEIFKRLVYLEKKPQKNHAENAERDYLRHAFIQKVETGFRISRQIQDLEYREVKKRFAKDENEQRNRRRRRGQ